MQLISRRITLALWIIALPVLNGCTVLGIVADNAIFDDDQRSQPVTAPTHIYAQDGLFSEIGLEADIAVVKKVIAVVKGKPEQPKTRCIMKNGIRFCYEEGAQGY